MVGEVLVLESQPFVGVQFAEKGMGGLPEIGMVDGLQKLLRGLQQQLFRGMQAIRFQRQRVFFRQKRRFQVAAQSVVGQQESPEFRELFLRCNAGRRQLSRRELQHQFQVFQHVVRRHDAPQRLLFARYTVEDGRYLQPEIGRQVLRNLQNGFSIAYF